MSKIYLASDHAGYELKNRLLSYLTELGHETEDVGPSKLNPEDDYPDFITPCAKRVAEEKGSFGIIIGKSGQGEAMVANRIPGARAAVFYGGLDEAVKLPREHEDANLLSLGAGLLSEEGAKRAVQTFLTTSFSKEKRHIRRINKF